MLHKHVLVLWFLPMFLLPGPGWTDDQPIHVADVAREFKGEFQWRYGKELFTLVLMIDRIDEEQGVIRFSGNHTYTPGNYKMKVEGTINPMKRLVSIRESDPSRPDSVTDGSFEGTISEDLQTIEAVWTTRGTGQKGDLKVQARKDR